jgi:hypothetical protein
MWTGKVNSPDPSNDCMSAGFYSNCGTPLECAIYFSGYQWLLSLLEMTLYFYEWILLLVLRNYSARVIADEPTFDGGEQRA